VLNTESIEWAISCDSPLLTIALIYYLGSTRAVQVFPILSLLLASGYSHPLERGFLSQRYKLWGDITDIRVPPTTGIAGILSLLSKLIVACDLDGNHRHRAGAGVSQTFLIRMGNFPDVSRIFWVREPLIRRRWGRRPLAMQSQAGFPRSAVHLRRRGVRHAARDRQQQCPRALARSAGQERPPCGAATGRVRGSARTPTSPGWSTAFARARTDGAIGVVVLMQANPRFELPPGDPQRAGSRPSSTRWAAGPDFADPCCC